MSARAVRVTLDSCVRRPMGRGVARPRAVDYGRTASTSACGSSRARCRTPGRPARGPRRTSSSAPILACAASPLTTAAAFLVATCVHVKRHAEDDRVREQRPNRPRPLPGDGLNLLVLWPGATTVQATAQAGQEVLTLDLGESLRRESLAAARWAGHDRLSTRKLMTRPPRGRRPRPTETRVTARSPARTRAALRPRSEQCASRVPRAAPQSSGGS